MRKAEQVCVRVTQDDLIRLRELATEQRVLLSEFVRRALTQKLDQKYIVFTPISKPPSDPVSGM